MNEPDPEEIDVLVISPIPSLRVAVGEMLSNLPQVKLIGETGTLVNASARFCIPDILVIAAVELPESELGKGREWFEILQADFPGLPVLWMVDPHRQAFNIAYLVQTRPTGLLPLDSSEIQISATILALVQRMSVISEAFSAYLGKEKNETAWSQAGYPDSAREALVDPLTRREKEILQALGVGLSNKEIALQFKLSDHTVKYHLSSIFSKLGASNRTEAVLAGVRLGLITL